MILYHGSFLEIAKPDLVHSLEPSNNSDSESIVVDGVSR